MTRKDRYFLQCLLLVLALQLLTSAAFVFCAFSYRRRFKALSAETVSSVQASERAAVDACSSVLALLDNPSAEPSDESAEVPVDEGPVVRIVGYGQSRGVRTRWIYRDVEVDGVVHREFIHRMPLSHD